MWDGVDRRRFVRARYPCLITLRTKTTPAEAILTHTEDISVGGVRVIISKKIEAMVEVDLQIDLMDTNPAVASKGMVVRSERIPFAQRSQSPRYDTSIKFLSFAEEEGRRRIAQIVGRLSDKLK